LREAGRVSGYGGSRSQSQTRIAEAGYIGFPGHTLGKNWMYIPHTGRCEITSEPRGGLETALRTRRRVMGSWDDLRNVIFQFALLQKSFSFTPGFSPVLGRRYQQKPFQRFFLRFATETVKTVSQQIECFSTGLKPGVNENDF
jgi:hypothetical protein